MSAPTDLAGWLRAQLDTDESIAREAADEARRWWTADTTRWTWGGGGGEGQPLDLEAAFEGAYPRSFVGHILEHDPARVLADVAAKRRIIDWYTPRPTAPASDEELHARYAHPDYEYATTEGQRKAWDRADEPPDGDGWERNIDAGDNGWERFDYTEESYWRRLLPGGRRPELPHPVLRLLAQPYADRDGFKAEWVLEKLDGEEAG